MLQSDVEAGAEWRIRLHDNRPKSYPVADHDEHARSVAADAYWNQVRRTVDGKPVNEAQITLIVNAVAAGLALRQDDVILDLACGNGALSSYFFDKCTGLVGVDMSPYMTEVAQKKFARLPNYSFYRDDLISYVLHTRSTSTFTKALMYGAFQYISKKDAAVLLNALNERFSAVSRVFVGNLPDRRLADRFYRDRTPTEAELSDHEARIGVWYVPEEFETMARSAGWHTSFTQMPSEFYASTYRFDATLERL
jgi:cyclopropane fatty-acyl-phospholipid synthase-like methyltransferase